MDQWNKPLLGSRIDPEHPLSRGLVGCWLFNENSGNRVYDLSGNGNDGLFVNDPEWVPGRTGQAIDFDGGNDYIDCGSLDIDGSLTIGVWVKTDSTSTFQSIVSKSSFLDRTYSLFLYNTGIVWAQITNTANNWDAQRQSSEAIITDWTHVMMVYNTISLDLYFNGVLKDGRLSGTVPSQIRNGAEPFTISKENAFYFNGLIDDVRIWNRALSAQEVWDLYINPYGFIYQHPKYLLTTPLRSAVNKFTAEHIETHFIAEPIETHFVAEAVETHFIAEPIRGGE